MDEQQHVAGGSIIKGPRPDSSRQSMQCMLCRCKCKWMSEVGLAFTSSPPAHAPCMSLAASLNIDKSPHSLSCD